MFFSPENVQFPPLFYYVHAQSLLSNQALFKLTGPECQGVGSHYSSGGTVCSLHCLNDSTLRIATHKCDCLHLLYSFLIMSVIHPPALRFYQALCHLMHYSTDLCPLSLTMSCPPVFGRTHWSAHAMQVNVLIESFGVIVPGFYVHDVLLCQKSEGLFFMSFFVLF